MLTTEELSLIIQSLRYTKRNFENCQDYPSYEFKLARVKEVQDLINKLSEMKKGAKNENSIV